MAALGLIAVAASACATGPDAVDQAAGSSNRFVAGDGTVRILPAGQRKPAPAVTGKLLDGTSFDLSGLRGDVVVVNFWGSWCAPCRAEAADLETVYQRTKGSKVSFVGVNVKDGLSSAKAFQRTKKITYPSLYDRTGRVALQFRDTPPNSIPATLVLDRRGRVAALFSKSITVGELQPVVATIAAEGG
ncbi:MAG: TlpA disulfide reductase family protein [Mycobacteriales bacterium]